MKKIFKNLMYIHIRILTKIIISIKKPYIVLIVGSNNKSILREKLKNIAIKEKLDTRLNYMPYNTYFWVLLDFLNLETVYNWNYKRVFVYIKSIFRLLSSLLKFDEYIFLQWWIDTEWEGKMFVDNLKPDMIIFTDIDTWLLEDYNKKNIIINEYYKLISYLNNKTQTSDNINIKLEEIMTKVKNKEKWIWVIIWNGEQILLIWNKIKNSITIK